MTEVRLEGGRVIEINLKEEMKDEKIATLSLKDLKTGEVGVIKLSSGSPVGRKIILKKLKEVIK